MNKEITSRLTRLLNGSLHKFVTTVEKMAPEMVMEEAIRELNKDISGFKAEIGRLIGARHIAETQRDALLIQHQALNHNISIALSADRDELLEAAIAKQLKIESQQRDVETEINNCLEKKQEFQAYLLQLAKKKECMEVELSCFIQSQLNHQHGLSRELSIENSEETFNRLLGRYNGPISELKNREGSILLAQLEALSHQDAIQKRLALLKTTEA